MRARLTELLVAQRGWHGQLRWTLAFADPVLEAAYRRHHRLTHTLGSLRTRYFVVICVWGAFVYETLTGDSSFVIKMTLIAARAVPTLLSLAYLAGSYCTSWGKHSAYAAGFPNGLMMVVTLSLQTLLLQNPEYNSVPLSVLIVIPFIACIVQPSAIQTFFIVLVDFILYQVCFYVPRPNFMEGLPIFLSVGAACLTAIAIAIDVELRNRHFFFILHRLNLKSEDYDINDHKQMVALVQSHVRTVQSMSAAMSRQPSDSDLTTLSVRSTAKPFLFAGGNANHNASGGVSPGTITPPLQGQHQQQQQQQQQQPIDHTPPLNPLADGVASKDERMPPSLHTRTPSLNLPYINKMTLILEDVDDESPTASARTIALADISPVASPQRVPALALTPSAITPPTAGTPSGLRLLALDNTARTHNYLNARLVDRMRFNWWNLEFAEPALESECRQWMRKEVHSDLTIMLVVMILGEALFGVSDYVTYPSRLPLLLGIRYGATIPLFLIALVATRFEAARQHTVRLLPLLVFLVGATKFLTIYMLPWNADISVNRAFAGAVLRFTLHAFASFHLRFVGMVLATTPWVVGTVIIQVISAQSMLESAFQVAAYGISVLCAYYAERYYRTLFLLETQMGREVPSVLAWADVSPLVSPGGPLTTEKKKTARVYEVMQE